MYAQTIPGVDQAIQIASTRGWEAVVLVIIMVSGFSFFAYMFKHFAQQAAEREIRLSARIQHLEDLIRDKLFSIIQADGKLMETMLEQSERLTVACDRIVDTMHSLDTVLMNRPCMAMDAAARSQLVDAIVKGKN